MTSETKLLNIVFFLSFTFLAVQGILKSLCYSGYEYYFQIWLTEISAYTAFNYSLEQLHNLLGGVSMR